MPKVTILCGISGSGKSTYFQTKLSENRVNTRVCSADHYFQTDTGEYAFNPAELPAAHGACLRKFLDSLRAGILHVVVDNTNTTVAEIAPYAAAALAYGYELEIIKISCDVETACRRNVHSVPRAAIEAQAKRLESLELPPWWPMREA